MDTEFVSERSYRPVLCLVQIATADGLALIDPLAIGEVTQLWEALSEPGHETIVHAGRGEVEFCLRAVDRLPADLFDVQIAAGLVGVEYPAAFNKLVSRLLGKHSSKDETRTDWRRRPLTGRQIEYALDDARHLSGLRETLDARLRELGRLDWFAEEMRTWEEGIRQASSEERWRKVSGMSGLDRQSLAILRELWRWREATAERRDCPVRRVLRDDLLIELAKRKTADVERIGGVRGLDRGDLKRALPKIAESIGRALALPEPQWPERERRRRMSQLPVLGQFLFAAVGSECRKIDLSPSLVGTPNDIRELVAYRTDPSGGGKLPRLAQGWRAEVVGEMIDDLLAGRLAIRIGDPRSEDPLVIERL